jgi:hypothetical protein
MNNTELLIKFYMISLGGKFMQRYILTAMVICSFLTFGSSAWSLTINNGATDVGLQDTYFANSAADLPNSGDQTELNWANGVLGANFTLPLVKTITTANDWFPVDNNSGLYAFKLQDDPTYFFIKTGAAPNTPDHFLFTNNTDLDWAVIALSDLNSAANSGKISHVGELGGTSVPEPSMLMLFCSGLLGLGLFGRKKFRK